MVAAWGRLVFRDVSEKQDSERELRESEERGRAIIETSLDAVVLMNAEGRNRGLERRRERIFGWQRAEVIGDRTGEAHHPGAAAGGASPGPRAPQATGEGPVLGRRLELPAIRRDGTEFPVEFSINPLPGASATIFVGFIRDISQRKAAEAALAERASLSSLRADVAALLASSADVDASLRGCCALPRQSSGRRLRAHLDGRCLSKPVLILRASAGLYTHLDGPHAPRADRAI